MADRHGREGRLGGGADAASSGGTDAASSGGTNAGASGGRTPEEIAQHFDEVASCASIDALAEGLAVAFRAPGTPPFAELVATLFGRTEASARAGLVNLLLLAAGPEAARVLARQLGGLRPTAPAQAAQAAPPPTELRPEEAERVPEGAVRQLAAQAERGDPAIVERVSDFYAAQPAVVRTIGAGPLSALLAHVAKTHAH